MNWRNSADRYGLLSIAMHWPMLLLLVDIYACIKLRELSPRGSDLREGLKTWHFMPPLAVFVLVLLHLAICCTSGAPGIQPQPALRQRRLAGLMRLALYAFMIAMPLLGWLILSAADKSIPFLGLSLPALMGADKALAGSCKEILETTGTIGCYLIGPHAAAALFHHCASRDNTLLRLLPCRGGQRL
ncbi:MAG: cytochrome b [Rhodanobacter sp.]|jgi:cytochrome b561